MLNGDICDFAGNRRLLKSSHIHEGKITVRLDFDNGETRIFHMPHSLKDQFAAHGAEQKLGDVIAGLKDIDDAVQAVDDLMDRLNEGVWAVKREASGLAGMSQLAKALTIYSAGKRTPEEVRAKLRDMSAKEKAALRSSAQLAPILAQLAAEKASRSPAKAAIDSDSLLADFGNE